MNQKVISLILVLAMGLSLAGCARIGSTVEKIQKLAELDRELSEETVPQIRQPETLPQQPEPTRKPAKPTQPKPIRPAQEQTQPTEHRQPAKQVQLHSGLRQDGTFSKGALFIGDSLTYGLVSNYLKLYDVVGDARYMAIVGAPLRVLFNNTHLGQTENSAIYTKSFYGKTYAQAIKSVGRETTAIYMMLGTNYDNGADRDLYIKAVDFLLKTCPNATVYMQLIPYSRSSHVHTEEVNKHIQAAYDHYQKQNCQRVQLIDTRTIVGYEGVGPDGIHLNPEGLDSWYNGLVSFVRNRKIPE